MVAAGLMLVPKICRAAAGTLLCLMTMGYHEIELFLIIGLFALALFLMP